MKKSFLALLIGSTAFTANATDNTGFYMSAKGGYSFMTSSKENTKYKFIDLKDSYDLDSKLKDNYTYGGAIGYDFYDKLGFPIRTEIEYMMHGQNDSKTENQSATKKYSTQIENKLRIQTLMLNAYFDLKNSTSFTPYIGAGIGYAGLKNDMNFTETVRNKPSNKYSLHAKAPNLAWSLSAGIQYAITPNVDIDLSYRYFNAGSYSFNAKNEKQNVDSKFKIESNDILLSVAYRF